MAFTRQLHGVLEVVTPSGMYYLSPTMSERLYLIWIFRNFRTLPLTVLTKSQQRKMELIVARHRYASLDSCDEILGTVEFATPAKKPLRSATARTSAFSSRVVNAGGD